MNIYGMPQRNLQRSAAAKPKPGANAAADAFKEMFEAKRSETADSIQISGKAQEAGSQTAGREFPADQILGNAAVQATELAGSKAQTKPVRISEPGDPGPDLYNKGVPYGARAQKVYNTLAQLRS